MPFFNKKPNYKSDLNMSASRKTLGLVTLEPRVLLDAAGVITGAEGMIDALGQQQADQAISNLFQPTAFIAPSDDDGDEGDGSHNTEEMETRLRESLQLLTALNIEQAAVISETDIAALTGNYVRAGNYAPDNITDLVQVENFEASTVLENFTTQSVDALARDILQNFSSEDWQMY